jgi:hypothetical protein
MTEVSAADLYHGLSTKGSATWFRGIPANTVAHQYVVTCDYITLFASKEQHIKEIDHLLQAYPNADMVNVYLEDTNLIAVSTVYLQPST